MKALTQDEVRAWRRDGYLSPLPLLDEAERRECLEGLARFERWLGAPVNASRELKWRTMPHLTLPWAARLAQDPRILDRVEDLLGPDLLIYTSTFFIKEAGSPTVAAWHQDSTYYGLAPAEEITVWVALSDAGVEAGCMEVIPLDGRPRQMRHEAGVVENSVNRASQRIVEPLEEGRAVAMPLRAGEMSMHHGLTPHRSGPNRAGHRRIGLGLNYVPAEVRPVSTRLAAMVVRGRPRHDGFELMGPPAGELDVAALAAHERAVALYRETYAVEEARHAAAAG